MNTTFQILLVRKAYCRELDTRYGHKARVNIPSGGKLEAQALRLIVACKENNKSVTKVMTDIFDLFSIEFCKQTFKTPWPPISVALSEKTLKRAGVYVKTLKKEDKTRSQYMDILESMDRSHAIELVKGGWPDGITEEERKDMLKCLIQTRS